MWHAKHKWDWFDLSLQHRSELRDTCTNLKLCIYSIEVGLLVIPTGNGLAPDGEPSQIKASMESIQIATGLELDDDSQLDLMMKAVEVYYWLYVVIKNRAEPLPSHSHDNATVFGEQQSNKFAEVCNSETCEGRKVLNVSE